MQRALPIAATGLGFLLLSGLTLFAVDVYASPGFTAWADLMRLCM